MSGFLITCMVLAFSGFAASLFFHLSALWKLNLLPVDWSNYEWILFFGAILTHGVGYLLSSVEPGAVFDEEGTVELNWEGCPKWMKFLAVAASVYGVLSVFSGAFSDNIESEWEGGVFSGICLAFYSMGFVTFYSKMKRHVAEKF